METEHGSVKHRGKHRVLLQHGRRRWTPLLCSGAPQPTACQPPRGRGGRLGGGSRSACPSKEQTGAGAGADGRTGAQPRSAPAPPASGRAALPQPVRQVDRFKLRSHRLSSFIQRDRCTQGRCPVVSWKGPGPRSFPRVAASPQVALLAIIPLPPTTSTLPLGEECEHRNGGADVSPGP